jgi:hypothetical protein
MSEEQTLDEMFEEAAVDDRRALTGSNALGHVSQLARDLLAAKQAITAAEATLAEKERAFQDIRDKKLPEAMSEVGLSTFTLDTGETLAIKNILSASMPNKDREPDLLAQAIAWLVANGHEDAIKSEVIVPFGKKDLAKAKEMAIKLAAEGYKNVRIRESVHYQTLNSLMRDLITAGRPVPVHLFNLYQAQQAVIS